MGAGSGTAADIVGADVAVIGTGGAVSGIAVVGSLVAGIVAAGPAAAGIAGMNRARPSAAGIGAVAVYAVITGSPIRSRGGNALTGSGAAYTNVAVIIQVATVDSLARIILGCGGDTIRRIRVWLLRYNSAGIGNRHTITVYAANGPTDHTVAIFAMLAIHDVIYFYQAFDKRILSITICPKTLVGPRKGISIFS